MSDGNGYHPLSQREFDCVNLVAQGMTSNAIARQLGLSTFTVDTHIRRAIRKVDAQNRAHLVYLTLTRRERIRMQPVWELQNTVKGLLAGDDMTLDDACNVALSSMSFALIPGVEGRGAVIDVQRSTAIRTELLAWINAHYRPV